MRKEFTLVLVFLIVLPVVLFLIVEPWFEGMGLRLEVPTFNLIRYICLLLAILGCVYILIRNYALKPHSLFWYVFPAVTGVILSLLLYTVYSLAHFGF